LRTITWPAEVKEEFFAKDVQELPQVSYNPIDATPSLEAVREARRSIVPISPIDLGIFYLKLSVIISRLPIIPKSS
jgi:hypothetical protein